MTLLGGCLYIVSVAQYFLVQLYAAAAWHPPYDWFDDFISDLGNTACAMFATPHGAPAWVCSPRHAVMNGAFVASGALLVAGTVALRRFWPTHVAIRSATVLLLITGCGKILVGAAPENEHIVLHSIAALNIPAGNLVVLLFSVAIFQVHKVLAFIGLVAGVLGLVGTTLSVAAQIGGSRFLLGLGTGGMERLAAYPGNAWIVAVGITAIVGTRHDSAHGTRDRQPY